MYKENRRVILTSWDGDDGVGDLVAKVSLGGFLHLGQNHSGDFLRSLKDI
jgi:hypothetical protein